MKTRIAAVYLLTGMILILMLRIPYVRSGYLSNDEGVYTTAAMVVARGGALYRDTFTHKPPGFIYLYVLFHKLLQTPLVGIRWLFLISLMIHLPLFYGVISRIEPIHRGSAVIFMALLPCIGADYDFQACHPEMIMLLPLTASIWLLMKGAGYRWKNSGKMRMLLVFTAGVLFGAAFQMKQSALTGAIPLLYLLLVSPGSSAYRQKKKGVITDVVLFSIGFIVCNLLIFLPVIIKAGMKDFRIAYTDYNYFYFNALQLKDACMIFISSMGRLFRKGFIIWISAGSGLVLWCLDVMRRRREKGVPGDFHEVFLFLWLGSGLLGAFLGKKGFHHYFIQCMPPVAAWAGYGFGRFGGWIERTISRTSLIVHPVLYLGIVSLFTVFLNGPYTGPIGDRFVSFFTMRPHPPYILQLRAEELANALKHSTKPGDRLFVWGFFPQIYALSDRLPATRFSFCQPLTGVDLHREKGVMTPQAGRFVKSLQRIAAGEFKAHPPVFVIDTAPIHFWGWDDYPLDTIPEIKTYIDENYRKLKDFYGMELYRLKR